MHGSGAEAPRGQYDPWVHGAHAVLLGIAQYEPPSHGMHWALRADIATLPGVQGVAMTEPVGQLEPSGHSLHCALSERPVAFEYVPLSHGRGAEDPSGQ